MNIIISLLMILTIAVICAVQMQSQESIYYTKIELGKDIFSEVVEKTVFVTDTLDIHIFTSGQGSSIAGPESRLYEHLVKNGVKMEDIIFITHNHFTPKRFTPRNNKTLHYFKGKGFKGFFGIYYTATKKARVKKDE